MNEYDESVLRAFLKMQYDIFDEQVAGSIEEAEEFLEDCLAVVCDTIGEVRDYFEEEGTDLYEMDDRQLMEADEVHELPDGRFLVLEV